MLHTIYISSTKVAACHLALLNFGSQGILLGVLERLVWVRALLGCVVERFSGVSYPSKTQISPKKKWPQKSLKRLPKVAKATPPKPELFTSPRAWYAYGTPRGGGAPPAGGYGCGISRAIDSTSVGGGIIRFVIIIEYLRCSRALLDRFVSRILHTENYIPNSRRRALVFITLPKKPPVKNLLTGFAYVIR